MDNIHKYSNRKKHHFRMNQGETWIKPMQWKNADGSPKDITDFKILWQIRKSTNSPIITVVGDYEIFNAKYGMFSLILFADKSSIIPTNGKDHSQLSKYVYDVKMVSPYGAVTRILHGFILISPEVTQ